MQMIFDKPMANMPNFLSETLSVADSHFIKPLKTEIYKLAPKTKDNNFNFPQSLLADLY